jgi:diketogulonate reductase-like aldo/keto reductase
MPACYPDRRERDEQDWRVVEVVTDIAPGLGCSPAQVGLARVMRQPAVAATTVEQLKLNLAASEIGLDAAALQALDTASRRPLGFPYRLSSDSSPQPARNRSPTIASLPSLIDEDPPPARLLTRRGR